MGTRQMAKFTLVDYVLAVVLIAAPVDWLAAVALICEVAYSTYRVLKSFRKEYQ
jgi:hypothetical protein